MSRSFKPFTIEEFESFVDSLSLRRKVTHVQIHHTWKPRKTDYKGESTIYGMWNYHVNTRKWVDIGQHFSIAPDGTIWDGRRLEVDPAGISGNNSGGIMFEIIGNFDEGEEVLDGKQLYAVTRATAVLLKKFNLTNDDIVFHREHSAKTCPGTGIKKAWFVELVKRATDPGPQTSEWAKDAHKWVVENKISDGKRPKDPVTREELWTILRRMKKGDLL